MGDLDILVRNQIFIIAVSFMSGLQIPAHQVNHVSFSDPLMCARSHYEWLLVVEEQSQAGGLCEPLMN